MSFVFGDLVAFSALSCSGGDIGLMMKFKAKLPIAAHFN